MSRDGNCRPEAALAGRRGLVTTGMAGVAVLAAGAGLPTAGESTAGETAAARPIDVALLTHSGGAHLTAYLRGLAASAAVGRVTVGDPDGACFAEARDVLGPKLLSTHRGHAAALEAPVGLALVSTEAAAAPRAIRAALERGCHVLAEKPACTSADDFAALAALADTSRLHLSLALANRLNPEVVEARRLVAAGTIGRPLGLEMHLVQDRTRLFRPGYGGSWFADPARAGGGHLAWLGIHWLDLAMLVTGARIEEVVAFTANSAAAPVRVEDSAVLALRFAGGFLGTLAGGYWLDAGHQSLFRVWGTKGWLSIDGGDPAVLRVRSDGEASPGTVVRTEPPGDAYSMFVHAVAGAVARGETPPVDTAASLRVVRTVFSAYEAAAQGRAVAVLEGA